MKYQVVLYNLKNGVPILEGKVIDEKPERAWAIMSQVLYGAESYEIREIKEVKA